MTDIDGIDSESGAAAFAMILFIFSGKSGRKFNVSGPYPFQATSAGNARAQAAGSSGTLKMAEIKGTARIFGRRANPTIAFDPESEVKAIERRRKADFRAERMRARKEKTLPSSANAKTPSAMQPEKPRARRFLVAGLACLALAVTLAGIAPQVLPAVLP